jgi:fucose 4-O-acetylase-like acetyltransferase
MPLFMLISGYLFQFSFRKRDMKALIVHRSKPLLFTIVFCGIVIYYTTDGLFAVLNGDFGALLFGQWLESLSGLWFLWAVLIASLLVTVICKTVQRLWLQIPLLLMATFLILLFPNAIPAIYMYPYFLIGFYYAAFEDRMPKLLLWLRYVSIPLFPVMMLFFEKKHFIYTTGIFGSAYPLREYVTIDLFRWVIGGVGSIFVITVLDILFRLVTLRIKMPILANMLARLGHVSLQVYALSTIFVSAYLPRLADWVAELCGGNVFARETWLYSFGITLPLSVAFSFGLYWLVKLCDKMGVSKLLFGR